MIASYLINKNICLYFRLKKLVGKQKALIISRLFEASIIYILEREKYEN